MKPRRHFVEKETEQMHVCLGGVGLARDDDRRYQLSVLDSLFGGSLSSRLFQEIREKRGPGVQRVLVLQPLPGDRPDRALLRVPPGASGRGHGDGRAGSWRAW